MLSPLLPQVASEDSEDNTDDSSDSNDTDNSNLDDSGDSIPSPVNIEPRILTTSGPGEVTRMQAYSRYGEALGNEINNIFPTNYLGGTGIVAIDANNNGLKDQIVIFATNNGGPHNR